MNFSKTYFFWWHIKLYVKIRHIKTLENNITLSHLNNLDLYSGIWLDFTVTKIVFQTMAEATASPSVSGVGIEIMIDYDISLRGLILRWVTCILAL